MTLPYSIGYPFCAFYVYHFKDSHVIVMCVSLLSPYINDNFIVVLSMCSMNIC
jgi:hypothetical protein